MPRAARIWPNIYFGRPGALTTLPYPRSSVNRPYDKLVYDFVTGTGQHSTSSMALGSRLYELKWKSLHSDNYGLLEEYWAGVNGPGPWVYIDPSANNLLMPNQAAPTNALMDTSRWATETGATNMGAILSNSNTSFIHRTRGTRSLQWLFAVSPSGAPQLNCLPPYRNWPGIPVVAGLPYTLTAWARPDGVVDSSIIMAAKIGWYNSSNVMFDDTSSGDPVMTGWTKLTAGGVAPAGAVYGKPFFMTTGSSITVGASIYIDEVMFEQDTSSNVNNWAPGTGVRAVEIVSLTEDVPFDAKWRQNISLTLRELAT